MRPLRLFPVLGLCLGFGASAAATVGYAQATGYYKRELRPSLYQPLNMLDGREVTAWCSRTGDHLADVLSFGFKGSVKIDEVRVATGNGFDEKTFQQFGRARKFTLKTASGATSFEVEDRKGPQAVQLNPALTGSQFVMEVADQFPAEDPEMPVCISDIVFFSDGKPLNGAWLTAKLKYDRQRAPMLGTWFGGFEGAADRFLSFYFDETFRYVYEPYDPAVRGKVITGSYEVSGNRVTFEIPGQGKVVAHFRRDRDEDQAGAKHSLALEGQGLPKELLTTFRDRP